MSEQSSEARESPGGSAPLAREQSEGRRIFKNALCRAFRPDAYGYKYGDWHQSCHRRADHPGPHWNGEREWNDGDSESRLQEIYERLKSR